MSRRKAKAVPHEDTHRWMVSYADFITLLFAFFVVMYAISSVNVSKYQSLAHGMHNAFNQKGSQHAPVSSKSPNNGLAASTGSKAAEENAFKALERQLGELQDADYKVNRQEGWIELDIKAGALFDSGSADLRPEAIIKIMKIAKIIKDLPYPVALEGYTDDIPISTPQYPSNWELSSARASALARCLTSFGVQPHRLSVTGFGEQYPMAENTSEEGRSKNRRVNMVIARDKSVSRLLNPEISLIDRQHSIEGEEVLPSEIPSISQEFK